MGNEMDEVQTRPHGKTVPALEIKWTKSRQGRMEKRCQLWTLFFKMDKVQIGNKMDKIQTKPHLDLVHLEKWWPCLDFVHFFQE